VFYLVNVKPAGLLVLEPEDLAELGDDLVGPPAPAPFMLLVLSELAQLFRASAAGIPRRHTPLLRGLP
jgi:hypothetical protein